MALFNIQSPTERYLDIIEKAPKRLRIGFSTVSPIGTKVSKDAVQAIQKTAKLLESLGHIVEEATPQIDGMALAKDLLPYGLVNALIQSIKSNSDLVQQIKILN
jgi:amidase